MLHIHYGNSVEQLGQRLIASRRQVMQDVLRQDWLIVQGHELGRWLQLQDAAEAGISANWTVLQPATAIWRLAHIIHPEVPSRNPLSLDSLALNLMAALPVLAGQGQHPHLTRFMQDRSDRQQLAFCRKLARQFDQYLVFRPDMIHRWESGRIADDEALQAAMWNATGAHCRWHWAAVLEWLATHHPDPSAPHDPDGSLPAHIDFFFLHTLSPGMLSAVQQLAAWTDISLYQWMPSREYWSDQRRLADDPAIDSQRSPGRQLLVSMGVQLREMTELLVSLNAPAEEHFEPFADEDDLLSRLRRSALDLREFVACEAIQPAQVNLSIHAAHSRRREVEICHDQLLDCFRRFPDLKPHQVLVVAPSIDHYASYIACQFSSTSQSRAIPWRLLSRQADLMASQSLMSLLKALSVSDVNRSVFEHLPLCQSGWGLSDDDLQAVLGWIERFGVFHSTVNRHRSADRDDDRAERQQHTPDKADKFSWRQSLQRLIEAALGIPTHGIHQGSGLSPIAGSDLSVVWQFCDLLSLWHRLHQSAQRSRTVLEWQRWMLSAVDALSGRDEVLSRSVQPVFDALASLVEDCHSAESADSSTSATLRLDADALMDHLGQQLDDVQPRSQGHAAGVLCADASAVRLMPARVIVALGLNDGEFPSTRPDHELDLIARHPRLGDRSRRLQDRELFLEWLLSARDALVLSYQGRDPNDHSVLAPSTLIAELQSLLDGSWQVDCQALGSQVLIEHPPQPFSSRYNRSPGLISYAHSFNHRADSQASKRFSSTLEGQGDLTDQSITPAMLIRTLSQSAAAYLQQGLQIRLDRGAEVIDEDPPVTLDALSRYRLITTLTDHQGAHPAVDAFSRSLSASPLLPDGRIGALMAGSLLTVTAAMLDQAQRLCGPAIANRPVRLALDRWLLEGELTDLHERGRVEVIAAKRGARHELAAWIRHLFWCASEPEATETHLLDREGKHLSFAPLAETNAKACLLDLLGLAEQARREPLLFWPATSLEALTRLAKEPQTLDGVIDDQAAVSRAIKQAMSKWFESDYGPAEGQREADRLVYRDWPWWQQQDACTIFMARAVQVFQPMRQHRHD